MVNRHLDERLDQQLTDISRKQTRERMSKDQQLRTMKESLVRESIMERVLEREHLRLSGLTFLAKILNKEKGVCCAVLVVLCTDAARCTRLHWLHLHL